MPAGIVTATVAPPLAGIVLGVTTVLRTVPLVALSSRKVMVSPVMKDATVPFRVVGTALIDVDELNDSDGEATTAEELVALSAPVQRPRTGVTLYLQVPAGTAASVQVRAATAPEQEVPTVCATLDVSYRVTR